MQVLRSAHVIPSVHMWHEYMCTGHKTYNTYVRIDIREIPLFNSLVWGDLVVTIMYGIVFK